MQSGYYFWETDTCPEVGRPLLYNMHRVIHRLSMEVDLQNLFRLLCVQLYSLAENPQPPLPPVPPHWGSYTRALLVSKDRGHVFVTPWLYNEGTVCAGLGPGRDVHKDHGGAHLHGTGLVAQARH